MYPQTCTTLAPGRPYCVKNEAQQHVLFTRRPETVQIAERACVAYRVPVPERDRPAACAGGLKAWFLVTQLLVPAGG